MVSPSYGSTDYDGLTINIHYLRPTRTICCGRPREDVTRMLRTGGVEHLYKKKQERPRYNYRTTFVYMRPG